jgi:hypothetical protein
LNGWLHKRQFIDFLGDWGQIRLPSNREIRFVIEASMRKPIQFGARKRNNMQCFASAVMGVGSQLSRLFGYCRLFESERAVKVRKFGFFW